jgi:Protein of unknown function (DUF1579)
MNPRRVVYAITALALATGMALADEPKKEGGKEPDLQAMLAAYQKAAAPGAQHKQLQKMVGKWNLTFKSWQSPDKPPAESKGTAETKSLLGDRYVQTSIKSNFMGRPFSGIGTTGYDNTRKKFVGSWIDSMSTGIMRSEGIIDDTGKVMTSDAVGTDPLTGEESRTRIVGKWESDNKMVEEFYEKRGGKEMKTMEITYTRAK